MATEGCQFGQESIYLNVTRVSLAQLPGGDVERVCLWLPCPLTYMPHAPQTIANSSFPLSLYSKSQGRPPGMKSTSTLSYMRIFAKKHTYSIKIIEHISILTLLTRLSIVWNLNNDQTGVISL